MIIETRLFIDIERVIVKKLMSTQNIHAKTIIFTLAVVIITLTTIAAEKTAEEPRWIDAGPIGGPPEDAIILFDGSDISKWQKKDGSPAQWIVKDGTMTVNATGGIFTKQKFGDVQLHLEWASPSVVKGNSQGRGNSGVYLQGRYEIQILDSYENKTYFNGQAGAFYSKFAPLVNPCRKPGQWQTYDIIFQAPKPTPDGKSVQPGSFTVLFNGVLVQNHVPIKGNATTAAAFSGAVPKGPLMLQDHGNPVKFRNIWIRPLN